MCACWNDGPYAGCILYDLHANDLGIIFLAQHPPLKSRLHPRRVARVDNEPATRKRFPFAIRFKCRIVSRSTFCFIGPAYWSSRPETRRPNMLRISFSPSRSFSLKLTIQISRRVLQYEFETVCWYRQSQRIIRSIWQTSDISSQRANWLSCRCST